MKSDADIDLIIGTVVANGQMFVAQGLGYLQNEVGLKPTEAAWTIGLIIHRMGEMTQKIAAGVDPTVAERLAALEAEVETQIARFELLKA